MRPRPHTFSLCALLGLCAACRDAPVGHRLEGPLLEREPLPACTADASAENTACPVESLAVLDNPHLGFASFHLFARDRPLADQPRGSVAYFRFWWDELEPNPGELDFSQVDDALARARLAGQTFAFRVMPEESRDGARRVPKWLADAAGGTWGTSGVRYFSPNYESPAYLEAVTRTALALGARYDGVRGLDHVDVGFVGDSGEWAQTAAGGAMPTPETARRLIDAVVAAFPKTHVIMNVGSVSDGAAPLQYALSRGAGWRADCWGDFRSGWNHHDDFFEQQLTAAGALDAWKTAPVAVETCGETELWKALGYDVSQVRWALRWALDHHVTLVNDKSRNVPREWRPLVDEYLTATGYRFAAWRVRSPARAPASSDVLVRVDFANRGVAPTYFPYRLAVRLRSGEQAVAMSADGPALAAQLPGLAEGTLSVRAPAPGLYALDLAVVNDKGAAVVWLANEGSRGDRWLPVAEVRVE